MARRRRSGRWTVGWVVILVLGALAYKYGPWGRGPAGIERSSDIALMGETGAEKPLNENPVGLRKISTPKSEEATPKPQEKPNSAPREKARPEALASLEKPSLIQTGSTRVAAGDRKVAPDPSTATLSRLVETGEAALREKRWGEARAKLSQALRSFPEKNDDRADDLQRNKVIERLEQVANTMTFSPRMIPGDPTVASHTVQPGESLAVIARKYAVTPNLLARINQLPNKNLIQAEQTLKGVQGPLRAVVHKKRIGLNVDLADTVVRLVRVGLGEDGSTPTGQWRVKNKLVNPTYYPPRGGKLVPADAPDNPLGERWIGLEGIDGEAMGKQKYGIHGTIEPQSIGKSMSMGCVRLRNDDIEKLYDLLVPNASLVEIRP